jgi:hypothetical protein
MRRNNLSRSDEGNVQIASSISRAVLINAYDTAGDRAGKGDRNSEFLVLNFQLPLVSALVTSNLEHQTSNPPPDRFAVANIAASARHSSFFLHPSNFSSASTPRLHLLCEH